MRTLYVVTHPEATHHVEGLVGGWYDSRLTPKGLRAARAAAEALRAEVPAGAEVELYASDLQHTVQTAASISERFGVRAALDPRLREMSFGEVEGQPKAAWDRLAVPPPVTGDRMGHRDVPGGETKRAVAQRVYEALDDIIASPCGHQILVTHGFALTFVVAAWVKMPLESVGYAVFKAPSGSITTLHEDDVFRGRLVIRLGDARHLDALPAD
jgi:probable phosphoglycerate mutase